MVEKKIEVEFIKCVECHQGSPTSQGSSIIHDKYCSKRKKDVWERTFGILFITNDPTAKDVGKVYCRPEDMKDFIRKLIKVSVLEKMKKLGQEVERMKNTREMRKLEGSRYTQGFEKALELFTEIIKK